MYGLALIAVGYYSENEPAAGFPTLTHAGLVEELVLLTVPESPGALHYTIHSYDQVAPVVEQSRELNSADISIGACYSDFFEPCALLSCSPMCLAAGCRLPRSGRRLLLPKRISESTTRHPHVRTKPALSLRLLIYATHALPGLCMHSPFNLLPGHHTSSGMRACGTIWPAPMSSP